MDFHSASELSTFSQAKQAKPVCLHLAYRPRNLVRRWPKPVVLLQPSIRREIMRATFCLAALLLLTFFSQMLGAEPSLPKPSGESIVSPDAKLELLFTRSAKIEGGLTEGPAVAPDGSIYFSDIPFGKDPGKIMRFDPKTMKTSVFAEDSHKSNGMIFDRDGNL